MIETEVWKPWRDGVYEASSLGRVRRAVGGHTTWAGRILKHALIARGYEKVTLMWNGRRLPINVHHVVAEAFHGPRPSGTVVNHIDANKRNNRPENLEYITNLENIRHAWNLGLMVAGELSPNAKLTWEVADEVRRMYLFGHRPCDIASQFSIDIRRVCDIGRGRRWVRRAA